MTEALTIAFLAVGVFFMFVASVGVLRLSDFYSRIHAPTKAATFGLSALLLAFAVEVRETTAITRALLVVSLIAATIPVGSHILMRAAYRARIPSSRETRVDEYREELERRRARGGEEREASDVGQERR